MGVRSDSPDVTWLCSAGTHVNTLCSLPVGTGSRTSSRPLRVSEDKQDRKQKDGGNQEKCKVKRRTGGEEEEEEMKIYSVHLLLSLCF